MAAESVAAEVRSQLDTYEHLGSGERAILLAAADGIDALVDAVAEGAAPLPLINGCRYAFDLLRKAAPTEPAAASGTAGALEQWLED